MGSPSSVDRRRVRMHRDVLAEHKRALDHADEVQNHANIPVEQFRGIQRDVQAVEADLPGLLVPWDDEPAWRAGGRMVQIAGVRAYLVGALARLDAEVAEDEGGRDAVVGEPFTFVSDEQIGKIVERDFVEAQKACSASCWKSTIILCGGLIEALLLDLLLQDEPTAMAAGMKRKPSLPNQLQRWGLEDLIVTAVELNLIGRGIDKLSHSVREYRNLTHPGNEVRARLRFSGEEARIALEVVNMLRRDLSGETP